MTALVVIAKECVAGRVKTRLHPPLSLAEAAAVAHVSLATTLRTARALPATRRILFFDGAASEVPDAAERFEIIRQPEGGLDERLGSVFDLLDEPTVLIGMDTPHIAPADFDGVFDEWPDGVDALFGPALDGGFWALGLRSPRGSLVRGIPMSRSDTGSLQRERLERSGLVVRDLRSLRDLDTVEDLEVIAESVRSLQHFVGTAAPTESTLR
ncbi:TIGR04282 family arsenosugar biosynthesis glycosyltransferase [Humibacter ginsenosidimutans]|uniref:DUF2064 domain-containing protein n=1 Tax=Humibacter ginsenosidimutans TaxID=2599293 RepID=A0A5B8M942_9MICO|nr:DUF2064 domain-containing protein [Humibacter ginsenosidimutans]QDZ16135.1 DUF2064 domain-containing protein [Humibacter ginsenosidimutans]